MSFLTLQERLAEIPADLKQHPNWVLWSIETVNGRPTKVPRMVGGRNASSTDPATWTTFEQVAKKVVFTDAMGLGFVVNGVDDLLAVDIDGCRNIETGELTEWADSLIDALDSYTEITPSQTGIRVWIRGVMPEGAKHVLKLALAAGFGDKVQIEVYATGKYFTVTGDPVFDPSPGIERRDLTVIFPLFEELQTKYPVTKSKSENGKENGQSQSVQVQREAGSTQIPDKLSILMHGKIAPDSHPFVVTLGATSVTYPSQSEADMALATLLAIKHGNRPDLIDADFRASSLYRPKWDRLAEPTIQKAITSAKATQTPSASAPATTSAAPGAPPDDEPEENFKTISVEPYPTSPIFPGPLTDLAGAIYPSLPLEFKMWALMTRWGLMRSGLDSLRFDKHLQGRFYVALVSVPNGGKTGANNESRTSMSQIIDMVNSNYINKTGRPFADVQNLAGIDSGPFLVGEFYEMEKLADEQAKMAGHLDNAAKIMHDPDELSEVFDKGRTTSNHNSTLFKELLKLHTNNRTGNGTRGTGKLAVTKAHLSILGGVPVDEYKALWMGTGSGSSGLMSRFIPIVTNAPPVPPIPLATDGDAAAKAYLRLVDLAQMPGQEVLISDEATKMFADWWSSIDTKGRHAIRVAEIVKQLLLVLAQLNAPEGHTGTTLTIESDLMQFGIDFGKYLIAIRERLNPEDSWSPIQAMENAIIDWMQKNASRTDAKTRNDCRRGVHPQRMPGGLGAFKNGWDNCVNTGVVKLREPGRKSGKYSL